MQYSVLVKIKANVKNGNVPLYARITVNGKWAELSLKRKLSISDWDSNKNGLKGLSDEIKMFNN